MQATISPDRRTLTITATRKERANLRKLGDEIQSDAAMHDAFEHTVCNSGLDWMRPGDTGDLTDAPMLGIKGEPQDARALTPDRYGQTLAGHWDAETWWQPILSRWGFEPYQLRSPLVDLRDRGAAVFVDRF